MNKIYSDLKVFYYPLFLKELKTGQNSPLHIRIKPTNKCNHYCNYCAFRNSNQSLGLNLNPTDEIPRDKMLEIANDIVEMGVNAVTFSGGGEPLCYPYLAEAMETLARGKAKVALLTNGALLSGEIAELFAGYASWVRVSIDGWDKESYKEFRRVDDFDKVMSNIMNFKSERCVLGINIVVTNANAGHIYDIVNSLKGSQVKTIKISPCVVSDDIWINADYHAPLLKTINSQVEKIKETGLPVYFSYGVSFDEFSKNYWWCPNIQIQPVIAADQCIYSCHDKAYEKEGLLGSFKDISFKEAWERADKFRINPSRDCKHHCIAHEKNKLIHSFLNIYDEHKEFC